MGSGAMLGNVKSQYYSRIAPSLPNQLRPHWRFICMLCLLAFIPIFALQGYSINLSQQKQKVDLVILIVTFAGGEADRRAALRDTYLQPHNQSIGWLFVVGRNNGSLIKSEQDKYKDLYSLDCADDFNGLSLKVLLGIEKAIELFDFKYILKVDTDTWVTTPNIVHYLDNFNSSRLYIGLVNKDLNFKHTSKSGKLIGEKRVHYMFGGGYALSFDLAEHLVNSRHLLYIWPDEDVTIGAHLQLLNIDRKHDMEHFLTYRSTINCWNNLLVGHKVSNREIYYLYYGQHDGWICGAFQNKTIKDTYDNYPNMKNMSSKVISYA